jgi:hypothetical protein
MYFLLWPWNISKQTLALVCYVERIAHEQDGTYSITIIIIILIFMSAQKTVHNPLGATDIVVVEVISWE